MDAQRNYNNVSLRNLRAIEEYFKFEKIDDEDVKNLGNRIVEAIGKTDREYSVCIKDMDNNEVFRYLTSDKAIRNTVFAAMKGNVVRDYKHTSIYPLIMYSMGFEDISYFNKENFLPVAGAFPLFEDNKLKYVVEISGFKEGKDFNAFIDGLSLYLNKKVPMFEGYLV